MLAGVEEAEQMVLCPLCYSSRGDRLVLLFNKFHSVGEVMMEPEPGQQECVAEAPHGQGTRGDARARDQVISLQRPSPPDLLPLARPHFPKGSTGF